MKSRRCIFTNAILQPAPKPCPSGCVHPDCPNSKHGHRNGDSCPSCLSYHSPSITPHSPDGIRHQRR